MMRRLAAKFFYTIALLGCWLGIWLIKPLATIVAIVVAIYVTTAWQASIRKQTAPKGRCLDCGYDLTGNQSGVCPECGLAIGVPRARARSPIIEYFSTLFDDSRSGVWQRRRLLYYNGLCMLLAATAFYFGPNVILFQKLTALSPRDFVPEVQKDCVPVVRAIKLYARDNGQLPKDVTELVPKYLAAPAPVPTMIWNGELRWYVQYHECITYDFTPGREQWRLYGELASGPIPVPPVTMPPASAPQSRP